MRHFPHNSRYCGKCFREIEEFLSYRVPVAVFQCDRIFGRDLPAIGSPQGSLSENFFDGITEPNLPNFPVTGHGRASPIYSSLSSI